MAEFCEGCPNAGSCAGPIESMHVLSSITEGRVSPNGRIASISFKNGDPQGPTDIALKYQDIDGGSSDIMQFHGNSLDGATRQAVDYVDKIERCTGPTEVKRFFGLVTRRECLAPDA